MWTRPQRPLARLPRIILLLGAVFVGHQVHSHPECKWTPPNVRLPNIDLGQTAAATPTDASVSRLHRRRHSRHGDEFARGRRNRGGSFDHGSEQIEECIGGWALREWTVVKQKQALTRDVTRSCKTRQLTVDVIVTLPTVIRRDRGKSLAGYRLVGAFLRTAVVKISLLNERSSFGAEDISWRRRRQPFRRGPIWDFFYSRVL